MDAKGEKRWKVGELARATGLTVRALHHYDEIELVVPVERSSGGHRLYGERDVERLYRVVALRRLGLPGAAPSTLGRRSARRLASKQQSVGYDGPRELPWPPKEGRCATRR